MTIVSLCCLLTACSEPATPENSNNQPQAQQQTDQSTAIQFQQDVHYKLVENVDAEQAKPPYLVEYFWFGCQHCQRFEPVLETILLRRPALTLVRKHAAVAKHWQTDARIFYTLQQMELEHLTKPLLELYSEKRQLTPVDLQQFLTTHQVDQTTFFDIAENSEQVINKMQTSVSEMQSNDIGGVPALVVNGRYLIIPHAEINSLEAYLALIDHLLAK
ncbi:thioredoxin domain-containing protein [Arsukibacterium indicum]|uniref:Thiol:disulfide interchange protein n=1 Tax=Arsukibacterium indicum TaxID=2848612 RepID=A0ABS6MI66_9GAMM|nr:thioredoxin domain-containing protein [Arsukibacterium indicum]MBV2128021.1 thioredoxin domain-containing protein [Arsukibacterium indicum]